MTMLELNACKRYIKCFVVGIVVGSVTEGKQLKTTCFYIIFFFTYTIFCDKSFTTNKKTHLYNYDRMTNLRKKRFNITNSKPMATKFKSQPILYERDDTAVFPHCRIIPKSLVNDIDG